MPRHPTLAWVVTTLGAYACLVILGHCGAAARAANGDMGGKGSTREGVQDWEGGSIQSQADRKLQEAESQAQGRGSWPYLGRQG